MELNLNQWYKILAPRPVVLVSTISADGISNAAPFSFIMPVSITPPIIAFASMPEHHTVKNILKTKDFVINIPGDKIINKLWKCAEDFPYNVSEIEKSGLTEEKSVKVKSPKIRECFAHIECKYNIHYKSGDHLTIFGDVVFCDAEDSYFKGKSYLISKANPLLHVGGRIFATPGKIHEV